MWDCRQANRVTHVDIPDVVTSVEHHVSGRLVAACGKNVVFLDDQCVPFSGKG